MLRLGKFFGLGEKNVPPMSPYEVRIQQEAIEINKLIERIEDTRTKIMSLYLGNRTHPKAPIIKELAMLSHSIAMIPEERPKLTALSLIEERINKILSNQ